MTVHAARLLVASMTILGFAGVAQAQSVTVTPAVQQACEWDYHNLCGQYAIGSELLDARRTGPASIPTCRANPRAAHPRQSVSPISYRTSA
jgi:hypothetical protein